MARIRASNRGKTDAVAAAARDIDFRHLWRQLRGAGWTSKRPRGIQTEWGYVSPDGASGFVGEDAVVVHAIESGLLAQDGEPGDADSVVAGEEEAESTDSVVGTEDIRASQIDTSVQLSQNTLDELFGSESDSDVELSQAAVTRAIDVSPSDLQAAEAHRNAVMNLRLLSEASGVESDAAPDDVVAEPPAPVLRPRKRLMKDVNFVPDEENMSAYESFSSGESDGEELDDGDDYIGSDLDVDDEDGVTKNDACCWTKLWSSHFRLATRS